MKQPRVKDRKGRDDAVGLLHLVADIRAAVGDPTGKLMQDELVRHCRKLAHRADWISRRVDLLLRMQPHLREPERTLVCDILANGSVLPDATGARYGFATTGMEHHRSAPAVGSPGRHPAMVELGGWIASQHPEDQHPLWWLADKLNEALHQCDATVANAGTQRPGTQAAEPATRTPMPGSLK